MQKEDAENLRSRLVELQNSSLEYEGIVVLNTLRFEAAVSLIENAAVREEVSDRALKMVESIYKQFGVGMEIANIGLSAVLEEEGKA